MYDNITIYPAEYQRGFVANMQDSSKIAGLLLLKTQESSNIVCCQTPENIAY
jgi:hypothetical protein